jgi:hypothetical protein
VVTETPVPAAHDGGGDSAPVMFLRNALAGTRVVVRYRLAPGSEAGATDALGFLHMSDSTHCVVSTKRGLETIAFASVIAAKEVPPPPHRSSETHAS